MSDYFKNISEGIKSTLTGMRATFKHAFDARKRRSNNNIQSADYFETSNGLVTVQYPLETIPIPDNGRYRLHNEIDDCIVCDKCAKVCPVNCIDIEAIKATEEVGKASDGSSIRLYAAKFDIDMAKCCYCGLCTTVCPTECLTMTKTFDYSEFDVRELVYAYSNLSPEVAQEKRDLLEQFQKEKEALKANKTAAPATKPARPVIPGVKPTVTQEQASAPKRPAFQPSKPKMPTPTVAQPVTTVAVPYKKFEPVKWQPSLSPIPFSNLVFSLLLDQTADKAVGKTSTKAFKPTSKPKEGTEKVPSGFRPTMKPAGATNSGKPAFKPTMKPAASIVTSDDEAEEFPVGTKILKTYSFSPATAKIGKVFTGQALTFREPTLSDIQSLKNRGQKVPANKKESNSTKPNPKPASTPSGFRPTMKPTGTTPTEQPAAKPAFKPTMKPVGATPTEQPAAKPAFKPTMKPAGATPAEQPAAKPAFKPTMKPAGATPAEQPAAKPAFKPTMKSTAIQSSSDDDTEDFPTGTKESKTYRFIPANAKAGKLFSGEPLLFQKPTNIELEKKDTPTNKAGGFRPTMKPGGSKTTEQTGPKPVFKPTIKPSVGLAAATDETEEEFPTGAQQTKTHSFHPAFAPKGKTFIESEGQFSLISTDTIKKRTFRKTKWEPKVLNNKEQKAKEFHPSNYVPSNTGLKPNLAFQTPTDKSDGVHTSISSSKESLEETVQHLKAKPTPTASDNSGKKVFRPTMKPKNS